MKNDPPHILPSNDNRPAPGTQTTPPLINLPPATKIMIGLFWLIYGGVYFLLPAPAQYDIYMSWGFVPAHITDNPLSLPTLTGLIGYSFLHGSWGHLIINSLMMAAFGKAVEQTYGAPRMLVIFALSSLLAAATHWLLNPDSTDPVIGASGGISGLFAIALLLLYRKSGALSPRRIVTLLLLFVGMSIIFGLMGAPDGGQIAWEAHIGGFIAGIGLFFIYRPRVITPTPPWRSEYPADNKEIKSDRLKDE